MNRQATFLGLIGEYRLQGLQRRATQKLAGTAIVVGSPHHQFGAVTGPNGVPIAAQELVNGQWIKFHLQKHRIHFFIQIVQRRNLAGFVAVLHYIALGLGLLGYNVGLGNQAGSAAHFHQHLAKTFLDCLFTRFRRAIFNLQGNFVKAFHFYAIRFINHQKQGKQR